MTNSEDLVLLRKLWALNRIAKTAQPGHAMGQVTLEQLQARIEYYGERCWICGQPYNAIDHVKPTSKGGSNWPVNLRPICEACNLYKAGRWPFTEADRQAIIAFRTGKSPQMTFPNDPPKIKPLCLQQQLEKGTFHQYVNVSSYTPTILAELLGFSNGQSIVARCRAGKLGQKCGGIYLIPKDEALQFVTYLTQQKKSPLYGKDPKAILGLPQDNQT